jgi:hypothetical protein
MLDLMKQHCIELLRTGQDAAALGALHACMETVVNQRPRIHYAHIR